jgi:cytochrome c553
MVFCSACHNDYGNGIIGLSLLGKDGDYIYGKIMDFKSGKKDNVLMKALVKQLDDERLKSISVEIAEFNQKLLKLRNEK